MAESWGAGSRERAGGAALTWMVQVYSLSSSSRTVQLYSRSRLLLLPLINLLSIFPPARPSSGATRRRCGLRTRRPSARQLRAGPRPLHHHPGRIAAAAASSSRPTPLPSPQPPPPFPPQNPKRAGLSPGRPTARAQLMGRSLGRGPMEVSAAEPIGRRESQSA